MRSHRQELWFEIPARRGLVNITQEVERALEASGIREGLCLVNAMHITASVFVNDDERGLRRESWQSGGDESPVMKIQVRDHGSLRVELAEGEALEILDGQGRSFGLGGRRVVTLCRCGQSKNKPFCDSSHKECAFDSAVEARDLPPPAPKP